MFTKKFRKFGLVLGMAFMLSLTTVAFACGTTTTNDPVKIGYLADYSGPLAEFGPSIEKGAALAVEQINEAGGINGSMLVLATGDTALDATRATSEANRLIDLESVFGIVGPLASGVSQQVAENVAGVKQVPVISPSSTSPSLSDINDNGFFFRTALSDAAQGKALADLISSENIDNVGVLAVNNAYGTGLSNVFKSSFSGTVSEAVHGEEQTSYLAELQKAADEGAEYLVAIGYPGQANVYLREAIENGLFEKFFFVDGTKSEELKDAVGASAISGSKGTAPGSGPGTNAGALWETAYMTRYGELPSAPFVKEAYDATILLALAAAKAESFDGNAVKDQLVSVATGGGVEVLPSVESIRNGLSTLSSGGEINYEGASSTVDWNSTGDITSGFVEIWEYNPSGTPEAIETVPFAITTTQN